ncbi:PhzF family phenazine biosynthesis protein [Amycolatopsis sp. NPDC051758]|uniref:PhzF family phenazine biosynthesis protein n=1 Tax=Amycolatopsis sp. NPDC051758 TaxID=3363935 RepID=UPI00379F1ECC
MLPPENDGDVRARIFTPVNELPFAGHPTLGTAIALGESVSGDRLLMETGRGTIPFDLHRAGSRAVSARIRQPVPTWEPYLRTGNLPAALGIESSTPPVEVYRNGPRHVFVGLPDVAANCFVPEGTRRRTRMVSPATGIAGDTAAGPLAVHLTRHGLARFGTEIEIRQGVEMGRTSVVRAEVHGSAGGIDVGGSAVVVAAGEFRV